MSVQKILEMAEKFVTLADEGTPHNQEYQEQRTKLSDFYDHFYRQLRAIVNEMGGDLFMLRERKFDPKMFGIFSKVYQELITLSKSIQEDKPYRAAEKLISYVTDRPTKMVLDNLNFLAKHHLQVTNEDFVPSARLQHPKIRSIDALNALAAQLKKHMEQNPLIVPPGMSKTETPTEPPPAKRRDLFGPENTLGRDDKTKV
jgi:hypothetical protein